MSPRCYKLSFKITGLLVPEKNSFRGFYHIRAWRLSWSCDLEHLYKLSFPSGDSSRTLALIGQAVSEKMFENNSHVPVHSQGQGQTVPCGKKNQNLTLLLFLLIDCKFYPLNDFVSFVQSKA